MPVLSQKEAAVGFDMFGCPNHCRHCFMSAWPNRSASADDLLRLYIARHCQQTGGVPDRDD